MKINKPTRTSSYKELFRGGDISVYFSLHADEFLPTAVFIPQKAVMPFGNRIQSEIGMVQAETQHDGIMTLNSFLANPKYSAQGYLVIHEGDIVYESYPRMDQQDKHLWMSCAKPTASLVIDLLISEDKINESDIVSYYLSDFKYTDWDKITVRDVLDMATGMDLVDTHKSRFDTDKIATKLYQAVFNFSDPNTGKVELIADILKSTKLNDSPGRVFGYSSSLTQMLVLLAESVADKPWHQLFDQYIWSYVRPEGDLQLHLSPNGIAAPFGLVSSNLRDMARFGTLFTPGWNKISTKEIVSADILNRIQNGVRTHEFMMNGLSGSRFAGYLGSEDFLSNSRQWDVLWSDGDMWKSGLMSQGLYVSPSKDLVIAYFGVNNQDHSVHRFVRPVAASGIFDKKNIE